MICSARILNQATTNNLVPLRMPPKRSRRVDTSGQGLSPGERLKRTKLSGNEYLAWGWVGTEVTNHSEITSEHRLGTCGFSDANPYPFCANKYSAAARAKATPGRPRTKGAKVVDGELEDDVIVVSEDESPACTSKGCRTNPNCLNYLGQDVWEHEGSNFAGLHHLSDAPR